MTPKRFLPACRTSLLAVALLGLAAVPSFAAGQGSSMAAPAAQPAPAGQRAFTIDAPNHGADRIHDVVVGAAMGRGWTVRTNEPDRVEIYLNHRKVEATVTFQIAKDSVTAYCEAYAVDRKGVREHPEQPTRWLNNLHLDIARSLGIAWRP